jgi:hypothetical protein
VNDRYNYVERHMMFGSPERHVDAGRRVRPFAMNQVTLTKLELRLGRVYARQRLGIERDRETQIFGQRINFFSHRELVLSSCHYSSDAKAHGIILARSSERTEHPGQAQRY